MYQEGIQENTTKSGNVIPEKKNVKWQKSWTVQRTNNAAPTATENRTVVILAMFEPRRRDSAPEKGATADTDAEALLVSEVLLGVPEIDTLLLVVVVLVERDDLYKIGSIMYKDISLRQALTCSWKK